MTTPDKLEPQRGVERLAGFVVYGSTLVGMAAFAIGVILVVSGNWESAGTFFIASAIAFGALANAILRN